MNSIQIQLTSRTGHKSVHTDDNDNKGSLVTEMSLIEKHHNATQGAAAAAGHEDDLSGHVEMLEYATGTRLAIVMATVCLSTLLIALDLVRFGPIPTTCFAVASPCI